MKGSVKWQEPALSVLHHWCLSFGVAMARSPGKCSSIDSTFTWPPVLVRKTTQALQGLSLKRNFIDVKQRLQLSILWQSSLIDMQMTGDCL